MTNTMKTSPARRHVSPEAVLAGILLLGNVLLYAFGDALADAFVGGATLRLLVWIGLLGAGVRLLVHCVR